MNFLQVSLIITGGMMWAAVFSAVLLFVLLVARDAICAAWFVCRFYSWGPLAATVKGRWHYPFRMWWWSLKNTPQYVVRKDTNTLVYWPGRTPQYGDDA